MGDEFIHHWVFKRTGWDNLELPGSGAARMRASRLVTCLDACTLKQEGIPYGSAAKKKQKQYQTCVLHCKMDDCNKDEECKPRLDAYADCKMRIGSSGDACSKIEG